MQIIITIIESSYILYMLKLKTKQKNCVEFDTDESNCTWLCPDNIMQREQRSSHMNNTQCNYN
jgi:hypothetical protein